MTSNFVVFDTSIFIDHLRTGRNQQRIAATTLQVCCETRTVVLAELSREATKPSQKEFVERLARHRPILTKMRGKHRPSRRERIAQKLQMSSPVFLLLDVMQHNADECASAGGGKVGGRPEHTSPVHLGRYQDEGV